MGTNPLVKRAFLENLYRSYKEIRDLLINQPVLTEEEYNKVKKYYDDRRNPLIKNEKARDREYLMIENKTRAKNLLKLPTKNPTKNI